MSAQSPVIDDSSERLRRAFHWIESVRRGRPSMPIERLIEQGSARFELSPAEVSWVRWTLDPEAVAIQPKEPASSG